MTTLVLDNAHSLSREMATDLVWCAIEGACSTLRCDIWEAGGFFAEYVRTVSAPGLCESERAFVCDFFVVSFDLQSKVFFFR